MRADPNLKIISLEECRHRHIYRLHSRNLTVGVFNQDTKGFIGIREKFGDRFLFTERHWDTGAPYVTANAYEDIGLSDEIELRENNPPVDSKTGRLVEWRRDEDADSGSLGRGYYIDEATPADSSQVSPVTTTYQPLFEYLDGLPSDPK